MKPKILSISTEYVINKYHDSSGDWSEKILEVYGLGDDGIVYFYDDDNREWIAYISV